MYNLCVSLSFAADPPEIEVERNWVHSGEGYEAQLVCIVHAEPPAEVSAPTSLLLHPLNPTPLQFASLWAKLPFLKCAVRTWHQSFL
jgi:hypothetical protein